MNYTFSPDLTVQLWSRMFDVDRNTDGEVDFQLVSPDFNTRSFQLNAVLRWEYRPGSTLFAVWSHDRSDFARTAFDLGQDLSGLWGAAGRNVFALKVSYWLVM